MNVSKIKKLMMMYLLSKILVNWAILILLKSIASVWMIY